MADSGSIEFDHYELIPIDETIRKPQPDIYAFLNSKPYHESSQNSKTEDFRTEDDLSAEKSRIQKQSKAQQQKIRVINLEEDLNRQIKKNRIYRRLFDELKQAINASDSTDQEAQGIVLLILQKAKENNSKQTIQNKDPADTQLRKLQQCLRQKEEQIIFLKQKLLQSTQNNIHAIFHTSLTENQTIIGQIALIKQEFTQMIKTISMQKQCRHQQKILQLIRNYEQMLNMYHKNEKYVVQLKNKQQQNFAYFSSLRSEVNHSISQACSLITNKKLFEIENQIRQIIEGLKNIPERVKTEDQIDIRVKELVNQIELLNERVTQRQIQIQKMREVNRELMKKSRAYEKCQLQIANLKKVEQKMREKESRIKQLQITIIQHMEAKARSSSINSEQSDQEKQKNNIRNLKTIISNFKQENEHLKNQLDRNIKEKQELQRTIANINFSTSHISEIQLIEAVSKDQIQLKVIEHLISVLIEHHSQQKFYCKCLQRVTETLIELNQQYPELEHILEIYGLLQKSTTIIHLQMQQQVNSQ